MTQKGSPILVQWLNALQPELIVLEATGGLEVPSGAELAQASRLCPLSIPEGSGTLPVLLVNLQKLISWMQR